MQLATYRPRNREDLHAHLPSIEIPVHLAALVGYEGQWIVVDEISYERGLYGYQLAKEDPRWAEIKGSVIPGYDLDFS